ncbi:MAG: hypothetical protein ACR2IF_07185 [Terriglobales bacterium]
MKTKLWLSLVVPPLVTFFLSGPLVAQSDDVASIKRELPSVAVPVKEALAKRSAVKIPEGPLKEANSRTVAALNALLDRISAVQAICDAGPTKEEEPVLAEEWRKVKELLPGLGLGQPVIGSAGRAAAPDATSPATLGGAAKIGKNTNANASAAEPSTPPVPSDSNSGSQAAAGVAPAFASPLRNLESMEFTYHIGVSVQFNQSGGLFQGGCTFGSGALTSDAAVWDVVVTLLSKKLSGMDPVGYFSRTNNQGVILVPLISMDLQTRFLVRGRKAYIGQAVQNVLAPKFHFRNLSLNEVTDLLEALKSNEVIIQNTFAGATPRMTVYQILVRTGTKKPAASILNALEEQLLGSNPDLITAENLSKALAAQAGKDVDLSPGGTAITVHVQPGISVPFSPPTLAGQTADEVSAFARRLANLGEHGDLNLANEPGKRLTSSSGAGAEAAPKPFVVENECFQLSFTPGVQNGGLNPAANFRGRISYVPEHSAFSLKLAAEGEAAQSDSQPRRIAGQGDVTYLAKPFAGGWYATFGAIGNYSYSQVMMARVDEWRAGGMIELQAPVQHFFPARGGNDQKPTLTIEGGAIGGTNAQSTAGSLMRGDFVYTLQPGQRMFLDFKANGGHASDHRFGGRQDFSFGSIVGRFAIYGDWDFILKYECGRKDPQYLKECGWQTGFGMRTK